MLSRCFLNFSMAVGTFLTGLSQISSFLYHMEDRTVQDTGCAISAERKVAGSNPTRKI